MPFINRYPCGIGNAPAAVFVSQKEKKNITLGDFDSCVQRPGVPFGAVLTVVPII